MDNDDEKQQALEQAQQAYGLFIWFVKWFSYVMIFMIVLMFMFNWFMTAQAVCLCQMKYIKINMTHKVLTKRKEYNIVNIKIGLMSMSS